MSRISFVGGRAAGRGAMLSLLLLGATAWAGPMAAPSIEELQKQGPDAVLAAADVQHNNFTDQELTVRMTIHGGTEDGKQLEFTTLTKGDSLRAIRFNAPADLKGMGLVVKGRDEIYVRLPDNAKVRRVAAHARKQSFQGTDFTFDDMAMIRLSPDFSVSDMKDAGAHLELTLTRKEGVDLPYPTLKVLIEKKNVTIEKIFYNDESGTAIKVQERDDFHRYDDGHIVYRKVVMRDLRRDHSTESIVVEEKINLGIPDSTFSKRWLVRSL